MTSAQKEENWNIGKNADNTKCRSIVNATEDEDVIQEELNNLEYCNNRDSMKTNGTQ